MSLVVVDDDRDVSRALRRLLQSMGHDVRVFGSAEEYEASAPVADCLILDVRLPGLNGFELRDRLHRRGVSTPIVFITGDGGDLGGHADAPLLSKPFDESDLLAAIERAVSAADGHLLERR